MKTLTTAEEFDNSCRLLIEGIGDTVSRALKDRERLAAETARLQRWVDDLQSGMYVNCVYCGHQYGPREDTPHTMADVLRAHIEECPQHPLSLARAKIDALAAENDRLREEVQIHRDKARDEYWAWQGDEEDHPESLTCPVLISASALRGLLVKYNTGREGE